VNFVPESFQGYLALRSASPPDLGKSVSLPAMSLHHAYFEKVNDWSKRSLPRTSGFAPSRKKELLYNSFEITYLFL